MLGAGTTPARVEAAGLPKDWVAVLDQHLEGAQALRGYVWLEMPRKIQHRPERQLEFRMLAPD